MKHAILTAVVLTLTGVCFGQNNSGNSGNGRPSFEKDYNDIVQRNPFLRERQAPRTRDNNRRPAFDPAASRRQNTYVLRGVAIEDDELHAYLEPRRGGEMRRVAPGDSLDDGRIVGIAIDAIAYEYNGQVQWIEIGQDLTGARNTSVASSSTPNANSSPTPPNGATQPTATPAVDNALPAEGGSLAERMRARARAQRGNR